MRELIGPRAWFLLALLAGLSFPLGAKAAPFDCVHNHCGIGLDAPYPNFVIGTIDGIGTPALDSSIFVEAQKQGYWKLFPKNTAAFVSKIQLLSILVAPEHSVTILADANEVRLSRFRLGDLARFAPHRGLHERPRPKDPYWVGIGCIVLLCLPSDAQCHGYYRPGIYRLADGAELDLSGRKVVRHGTWIDTMTMMPKPDKSINSEN